MAVYLRGAGGFSKSSQPYSYSKDPSNQTPILKIPKGQPFAVFEESTQPCQARKLRMITVVLCGLYPVTCFQLVYLAFRCHN